MVRGDHNLALRFQRIVRASPTADALVCEGVRHDFASLNAFANRLARWLLGRGIRQGGVICLELPKVLEAYAFVLACLKIGAPYVFLDPEAPHERAWKMVERCEPDLIISVRHVTGCQTVLADDAQRRAFREDVAHLDGSDLPRSDDITGTDPAYIMFTSGSTGEPKGAVIPHQGVLHLVDWAARDLGIGPGDRLSNVNPIFFDNSVFDLYASLLNGAALVAVEALKGRAPAALLADIARHACTFVFAVPTFFMFLDSLQLLHPAHLPSVTRFMFGGEGFPVARLRRFHEAFAGRARLINCYGPTETSCICSALTVDRRTLDAAEGADEGLPPLGRLNAGFSHRILDEAQRPVAPGETGELWLGGPCVGLGYIRNPEETTRRFRQDPLVETHRAIVYRTGDLVLQDPETGLLRFRGRADNQVKLRGYRVELEEIDHALTALAGVTRALAVVLGESHGPQRLVAAYTGEHLEDAALREHCTRRLPNYMIPTGFVWLADLPTNSNGKADRRAAAMLVKHLALAKAS